MGTHKGWLVSRLKNGSYLARARDPRAGKYRTRCFDAEGDAKRWAREMHAAFVTDQQSLAIVDVPDLVRRYLKSLERRGCVERHRSEVERILGEFASAVPDLGSADLKARIDAWQSGHDDLVPPTRNRYLAAIKALTAWAIRQGELRVDPMAAIERVKEPTIIKEVFTIDGLRPDRAEGQRFQGADWCRSG